MILFLILRRDQFKMHHGFSFESPNASAASFGLLDEPGIANAEIGCRTYAVHATSGAGRDAFVAGNVSGIGFVAFLAGARVRSCTVGVQARLPAASLTSRSGSV